MITCCIEKQTGADYSEAGNPEAASCEEGPELAVNANDALKFQVVCRLF
jgi:hypothetical protein